MAPTTPQTLQAQTKALPSPLRLATIAVLGVVLWYLSRQGLWWLAAVFVAMFEIFPGPFDRTHLLERLSFIIMGISAALIVTLLPKAVSQTVVAALYVVWRMWQERDGSVAHLSLLNLLLLQVAALQALFLAAAVWNWSSPVMIVLVWAAAYTPVWIILKARGERGAGVLAAAWALVAAELTWVFMTWLVSYIAAASYWIAPQPALILSGLAYCFGSIYQAQRQGKLNRARLTEYLLIGVILIAIVIAGTPWRGSI